MSRTCWPVVWCLAAAAGCGRGDSGPAAPAPGPAGTPAAQAQAPPANRPAPAAPHRGPEFDVPPIGPLPPVPVPADNPVNDAKVKLGRLLFFDQRTSGDVQMSCSSCHDPTRGWGDGKDISTGYPGARNWRNAPTVINAAWLENLFWAGEAETLEAQAHAAMTGNLEGNGNPLMIEERLAQVPEYVELFTQAFGEPQPTLDRVLQAIATFERVQCLSTDSPFDRWAAGDMDAMSSAALRGKALFEGKARCITCHSGPLLSDEQFHNVGTPRNPFFDTDILGQVAARFQHVARGVSDADHHGLVDLGRFYTSRKAADRAAFRTPPLRYLAYSAPYMHNGRFLVLEEVIDFFDAGGGDVPGKDPLLQPLHLTDAEKADLLAFLEALSGTEIIIPPPSPPPYRARGK